MNDESKKLLNILPYYIPEELFKQKIGTGDYLKKLKEDSFVDISCKGIRVKDSFKVDNKIDLSEEQKEKLHKELIYEFYLPKLSKIKIVDYDDFIDNYNLYINLSYHYKEISRYDDAFESLSNIAKKMQYWGMRNELIDLIYQIQDEKLNEDNQFLKLYYNIFLQIPPFLDINKKFQDYIDQFKYLEKVKEKNILLYLEIKNLEGIFYRIYDKNVEKAIKIHEESIELIRNEKNIVFNTVRGKIYENLSFCYQQQEELKSAKYNINFANEYILKGNDPYEIAKMYYYKMSIYYHFEHDEFSWVPCFEELNKYLEKYSFPDVERDLLNLLSQIELSEPKNFEDYFKFKTNALRCSLALYQEYFVMDFMSMFDIIIENKDEYKDQIGESLKYTIKFLQDTTLENERVFIELIVAYLKGVEYLHIKNKINNQSLLELFDIFTEERVL